MNHLPPMIIDLAVILGAAAVSTLIFSKLRQPVVLGYLIAGFAVGPHLPFLPTVVDNEGVKLWAEIGVIFLLFGLGLEFSFKKLAKVGKSAAIAAVFEILTMSGLGYLFGRAVGWSTMDSIYLGAILSMSSTTIIIRAFDESGLKARTFASLVFGILIVEDLMAILLMVVLSAISVPNSFSGSNLAFLSARLVFFLLIWFVGGIYIVPTLLKRVRSFLSDEIMLVVSIGLCLTMVVIATQANFSAALGAFIMGSILAETLEGERIEHLLVPVKNLFGAIFFVSVGMMIDPTVLRDHFGIVIMITVLTIVGKLFGSGLGAVLSGRSLRHSTQAGMSLAQIGEFSFIIASLGVSLKVVSEFLYPIVIAVSAVTTFTTPYMIKHSDLVYGWIEKRLPVKVLDRLTRYERAMSSPGGESPLKLILSTYGALVLLNAVVAIAIGFAASRFVLPFAVTTFGDTSLSRLLACLITLVACSPFLYGVVLKLPRLTTEEFARFLRLRNLQVGLFLLRAVLGLVIVELIIEQFAKSEILPLFAVVATPVLIFVFKGSVGRLYSRIEGRFLKNLNAKDLEEVEKLEKLPQLAPWNAHLAQAVVSSDSSIAGKTLEEAKFRTATGATIGMIDRGRRRIFAPGAGERILPNDELFLIGTDEQIASAQRLVLPDVSPAELTHDEMYNLESFVVREGSRFGDRLISEIGLEREFGALIVGVERDGVRKLNPESTFRLLRGDIMWVFGHRARIRELNRVGV